MANPVPAATPTRKSVTGFVTKLVGDGATYGFINDEIFFQQTNVTDGPASIGDRVFAECEYSELLPIKWNATSIKIIGRTSTGPANNILDSDPRRQSRQSLLNQQQSAQAPQNPSISAANTYQQPRPQRQTQQHDININQLPASTLVQQPPPVMGHDQANMNQQPEFFSPFAQPPPQLQDLQPFQNDMPMGPPKLEYTSQLGSAFVQNQFMTGPLLPQQPPPQSMLPQHQPQPQQQQQHQQQQQQQHQHQQQRQQPNHRDQKMTRDTNAKGRFNDKNERNQPNRGRNRADKKYEQPRSNERENSANARSSRSGDSRDKSSGHGDTRATKRDDSNTNSRQSPVSRPTNSANSDRGHNKHTPRRYYEPQNIPKSSILSNLNGWNIRSRCSSSIHVPSDLKNVIVNAYQRLDIKNMPKPIVFKIEQSASGSLEETKLSTGDKIKSSETEINTEVTVPEVDSTANEDTTSQSSIDNKVVEQITPPSSRSDAKLNHKYGVKVLLISLPELESIYKKVFGPELDSYSNESKLRPRLDEAISLLCNKGSNGGHSLIGGKFDPTLDGFVEGEVNEFERYGKQPDLIATCRRVVQEQTNLDLGPCQGWTLISTFLYNNKSDYFSPKSSVEYSFIYLPHIWSMVVTDLAKNSGDKDIVQINTEPITQGVDIEINSTDVATSEVVDKATTKSEPQDVTLDVQDATVVGTDQEEADRESVVNETPQACLMNLENISDLKVVDLKLELDKRDIKYKPNEKKADLALKLQGSLIPPASEQNEQTNITEETQSVAAQDDNSGQQDQHGKEEVASNEEKNSTDIDVDVAMPKSEMTTGIVDTNKRKSDELDEESEPETKKVCNDTKKVEKIELIKDAFVVRARQGQSQLSIVSLHEAVQISKYDQFELSVTSSILKESLIQHLTEYIFTTLVEDSRQKSRETSDSTSTTSSVSNSQDAANSDTNNNTATKQAATTAIATVTNQTSEDKVKLIKEYPVDRYINLAFAYFDSTHMGYIHADDLFRLFNNTGLTISKRALWSLIGEGDKFNYRTLPDLSPKFPPNYVYRFPDQFNRLPGLSTTQANAESDSQQSSANKMIEYQGVKYEVEKLIQQVRDAETNRVNMVQRFNDAISKHDQQEAEIHVLEVSQSSLTKSIKALNAEISDLKREKSNVDKRVESLRKQIKEAIKTLSE